MEPIEDDFFAGLKTVIQEERVPYRNGAWEDFQKKEKRRKPGFILPIISTAAVILMCGMIYFWPQPDHSVETKQQLTAFGTDQAEVENIQSKEGNIRAKKLVLSKKKQQLRQTKAVAVMRTSDIRIEQLALAIDSVFAESRVAVKDVKTNVKRVLKSIPDRSFDRIANEKPNLALSSDQVRPWKISGALNNSYNAAGRLTLGFGAVVDVPVTKHIVLSSGIGYSQLSSRVAGNPTMIAADMEKTLESVYTRVSGIDIPLEIKYSLSKNTAIGFGLSAMAVLRQQQTRNYIDAKTVVDSYTDADGEVKTESRMVVENTEETIKNGDLSPNSYLGFYNLSIGRRQKISDKQYITIEPFFKLPMHDFSSEKVKLISGGVRIKVDL